MIRANMPEAMILWCRWVQRPDLGNIHNRL